MASDHLRPRRVRCDSSWCEDYGREWTLHPRRIGDGLYVWDLALCAGCGCFTLELPSPSVTTITVQSPPIEVDFGPEGGGGFPPGKHTFASPGELQAWAAACMGIPVEQVIVELHAVPVAADAGVDQPRR